MAEKETFEAALRAVEEAVDCLERGDLPLEDSLRCFEEGVRNVALCRKLLQAVEERVELLLKDRDGVFRIETLEE